MSPYEFLRAAHIILMSLHASQAADPLKRLIAGEEGRDVQQLLLEVGISLTRTERTSVLPGILRGEMYDFGFHSFRALDVTGKYVEAGTMLSDRILGEDGLTVTTKLEFAEIITNLKHIDDAEHDQQDMYWRLRVKGFKYKTIKELKSHVDTAKASLDTTADVFSTSASQVLNKLLSTKENAEEEQKFLIKARTGQEHLAKRDFELVNMQLLEEYLREAASGANDVIFARRLHVIISRCVPLRLFEDTYDELKKLTGKQWTEVQETLKSFKTEIDGVTKACLETIEDSIDVMDFQKLPDEYDIRPFVEPLVEVTNEAFEKIKNHTDVWFEKIEEILMTVRDALYV